MADTYNDNKLILFHGSEEIVKMPIFGKGKKNNDYGRGFYCTESEPLAKEWACGKGNNGYANKYIFDPGGLFILDLNGKDYNILNWLALLTENRTYWQKNSISERAKEYLRENFLPDIEGFDVIKGYRADDSYFSFAQDFVSNSISLKKLSQAMRLGKLGEQIVLKSEKAFERICFVETHEAESDIYYSKKYERDLEARRAYRTSKNEPDDINDIFMLDIMREGMKGNDARLRL